MRKRAISSNDLVRKGISGSHGILVVYDVTNKTSFDNAKGWLTDLDQYAREGVHKMLVGNKSDHGQRKVTQAMGEKLASQLGIPFFETSAKSGKMVDRAFLTMTHNIKTSQ